MGCSVYGSNVLDSYTSFYEKLGSDTMWADASWISICDITDVSVESVQ